MCKSGRVLVRSGFCRPQEQSGTRNDRVHTEKILGYDSTPRVTAANFLCQPSDSKRFSYSSKRIFVTV